LTTALELRRRGVEVMVIERLLAPAPYAKAVGIQPRTVELWDAAGLARRALDAAVTMRGQLAFVDGAQTSRLELQLPDDIPYHFVALPQYETERVLAESLGEHGTRVRRGVELVSFTQDDDGVTATVRDEAGQRTVTARYLIGCDGAHSAVRKGLGLTFDGDAFAEEYMLADVEVDWDLPTGYGVRASHQTDGVTDDLLVWIPLPGTKRYRVSMLVPEELSTKGAASDGIAHGLEGGAAPQLHHIQAVLDRLSPQPVAASNMRWSSVFRISHRLVDRYGIGRVFVAGDAAHIHPPTGAQGMNTGVQDAYNLGWKLALAVHGSAADGLLESYQAERHPVGEEVVGRTVRAARSGIGAGETDPATVIAREAQLLVGYPDSPLVYQDDPDDGLRMGPVAGQRAPDASGLTQDSVGYPMRVHELLRHTGHTLLLWAGDASAVTAQLQLASELKDQLGPHLRWYLIAAPEVERFDASGCVFRDTANRFAINYGIGDVAACAHLVRPDGYLAFGTSRPAVDVLDHRRRTLRW